MTFIASLYKIWPMECLSFPLTKEKRKLGIVTLSKIAKICLLNIQNNYNYYRKNGAIFFYKKNIKRIKISYVKSLC